MLAFLGYDRRALGAGAVCALASLTILSWDVDPLWHRTYSPYQLLEVGPGAGGLAKIRAGGYYFQRILDLSPHRLAAPGEEELAPIAEYYELPYRVAPHARDVAVVGAGTGNDVSAALRMNARSVDAVEIDPAILAYGRAYHPERPYQDERVRIVIHDARSYLRRTERTYDLIVYGLLDSHALLSHASNVRLDSFVYTVEGFREARARLRENGVLSMSFCVLSPELGRKFHLMLSEAFDGRPPVCLASRYDGAVTFLQCEGPREAFADRVRAVGGFTDVSDRYGDPALEADVSTDDWPFMYMPTRRYPLSYLAVVGLMGALSVLLARAMRPGRVEWAQAPFALLGAGFMLIETKSITELGLVFGNTWQVIGIVIVGILGMAFVANAVVRTWEIRHVTWPFVLLLLAVAVGWIIARAGGFPSTGPGRLGALFIVTLPLFFSGIVFSALLRRSTDISAAMAANLVGAMIGGLLEYNAMYFGFVFLYGVVFALYGLAWLTSRPAPVLLLPLRRLRPA